MNDNEENYDDEYSESSDEENEYSGLQDSLQNILLDEVSEEDQASEEFLKAHREKVLSIVDPAEIGADEYEVFLDYTVINIINIMSSQIRTKVPDKHTLHNLARETISTTIATYDLEIAKEKNSSFRTHLIWKARQRVTDYVRAFVKASKNELNTSDKDFAASLEENVLKANQDGTADGNLDVDMLESHSTDKREIEQSRKMEFAMRQVRYELPKQSNLILDVGIGEYTKLDGAPYSLNQWAEFTGQSSAHVRKDFAAAKRLVKQKLYRKGFMTILEDTEKTSEDLIKDTNIQELIEIQERDESIVASTDIEKIALDLEELFAMDIDQKESED